MVGVYEGLCMGHTPGDEPNLDNMPQLWLYEALEGWNSVCGRAYNFKGIPPNKPPPLEA